MQGILNLRRDDSRIIIHFDYDCFYAAVVENENPALRSLPLAIQQKQIVVTCNYEARRRGLYKLQLITEAKQVCPDAVIVLGEDISRFRDASKDLYNFLRQRIWNDRAERLGFDEVWLDCTDMVEYNLGLLNRNNLEQSFFCMSKNDPTVGFAYDATTVFGYVYGSKKPNSHVMIQDKSESIVNLELRLILASHLARHLRHELESQKGYTATVGIATNKILSKLVGNVNKPKNQTTIMPPYEPVGSPTTSITQFMDSHDIGKVPGVGFKLSQKIRFKILGRHPEFHEGLVYGKSKESITVRDVRLFSGMGPEMLEDILGGPGSQKGIGGMVWELLHGIDSSEVGKAKRVPSQISQEDSYMKYLRNIDQVKIQLQILSERLIKRMHIDLMEDDDETGFDVPAPRRWLAHPRTLRLSTRPRPSMEVDGFRARTFHRISRSGPMPNFVFNLQESPATLANQLVNETLVPMFRKLHSEREGWSLSLINIAVTNMAETAAESKDSEGRNIGRMFRRQDDFLKDFKITNIDNEQLQEISLDDQEARAEVFTQPTTKSYIEDGWDLASVEDDDLHVCRFCHAAIPSFATLAHQQYHDFAN